MVLSLPRMGERPMMTEARADFTCWLASDTNSWEGEGRGSHRVRTTPAAASDQTDPHLLRGLSPGLLLPFYLTEQGQFRVQRYKAVSPLSHLLRAL